MFKEFFVNSNIFYFLIATTVFIHCVYSTVPMKFNEKHRIFIKEIEEWDKTYDTRLLYFILVDIVEVYHDEI